MKEAHKLILFITLLTFCQCSCRSVLKCKQLKEYNSLCMWSILWIYSIYICMYAEICAQENMGQLLFADDCCMDLLS